MIGPTKTAPRALALGRRPPQAPAVLIDWGSLSLRQEMFRSETFHGASGMATRLLSIPRLAERLLDDDVQDDYRYYA